MSLNALARGGCGRYGLIRFSYVSHTFLIQGYLSRQTDRQTDRQTERQRDRETERQRDRVTERQADRQAGRQTEREREQ